LLVFLHHFEQIHGPDKVVLIVLQWLEDRLVDCLLGSEVHDSVDGLVLLHLLLENLVQKLNVHDVSLMQGDPFVHIFGIKLLRQNFDHPFKHVIETVGKVVEDDEVGIAGREKLDDGVGSDKA